MTENERVNRELVRQLARRRRLPIPTDADDDETANDGAEPEVPPPPVRPHGIADGGARGPAPRGQTDMNRWIRGEAARRAARR